MAPQVDAVVLEGGAGLVLTDGTRLPLGPLGELIAARLAIDGPQPRADLAQWLWPKLADDRARANLRQQLMRLRDRVGEVWIVGDKVVALRSGIRVRLPRVEDAGDLLAGATGAGSDTAAEWLQAERDRLRRQRVEHWARTAATAEAQGRGREAIAARERAVALDPHAEDQRRELMRLHHQFGDRARALATYCSLAQMLDREFGAPPSPQTLALRRIVERSADVQSLGRWTRDYALERPPKMVDREHELEAIRKAWLKGQAVCLIGEAGVGKSRLVAELAQQARQQPVARAVMLTRALSGDSVAPFFMLSRLARLLVQRHTRADLPARLSAALARLLPDLPSERLQPSDPAADDPLALIQALKHLLHKIGPCWLALDDLHNADDASLDVIRSLVADDSLDVLWCLAQRPASNGSAAHAMRLGLESSVRLHCIAIAPLSETGIAELLRSLEVELASPDRLARQLKQHTGGNPLFVLETIRAMLGQPAFEFDALPQPASALALIQQRLAQLSSAAASLIRIAAIAGVDFSPALAEAVSGRSVVDLADPWQELEDAHLLRETSFVHDLVGEATLARLPKGIARHLHGSVARWLETAGGEPARVAVHWIDSGQPQRALPFLVEAADRAATALRASDEASFLERAVAILCNEPHGDDDAAKALDWLLRAATARWIHAGAVAARPLLEQAKTLCRTPQQRLRVLVELRTALEDTADFAAARSIGLETVTLASGIGDEAALAHALFGVVARMSSDGDTTAAAALVGQHWQTWLRVVGDTDPTAHATRAMLFDHMGRVSEAAEYHEEAVRRLDHVKVPAERLAYLANFAVNRIDAGDYARARQLLQRSSELELAHEDARGRGHARLRAIVARDLGEYERALREFDAAIALEVRNGAAARQHLVRLNRAWLWLHVGRVDLALQDLPSPADVATLPRWVGVRIEQLARRIRRRRGQVLIAPAELLTEDVMPFVRLGAQIDRADEALEADAPALQEVARSLARLDAQADELGLLGSMWAARWVRARILARVGDTQGALELAEQCATRSPHLIAQDIPPGRWLHGLWQVHKACGRHDAADQLRARALEWIEHSLRSQLPTELHACFAGNVAEHRELRSG